MKNVLRYDGPVIRILSIISDLIILNTLWLVTSLPVITMGASTTALYKTALLLAAGEEPSVVRCYFSGFRSHFMRNTCLGVLTGLVSGLLIADLIIVFQRGTDIPKLLGFLLVPASLCWFFICLYVFPVAAVENMGLKQVFKRAAFTAVRKLPLTVITAVLHLAVFTTVFFDSRTMAASAVIFTGFGMALLAFLSSFIYRRALGLSDEYKA